MALAGTFRSVDFSLRLILELALLGLCTGFLVLSAASMLTAPVGARVAHSMQVGPLKRVFAFVLYALASYFILR